MQRAINKLTAAFEGPSHEYTCR